MNSMKRIDANFIINIVWYLVRLHFARFCCDFHMNHMLWFSYILEPENIGCKDSR